MKKDIHPTYYLNAKIICASALRAFLKPCGFNISANRENYVFPTPFLCNSREVMMFFCSSLKGVSIFCNFFPKWRWREFHCSLTSFAAL